MSNPNLNTVKNVIIIKGFDEISVTPDVDSRYASIYKPENKTVWSPDMKEDLSNVVHNIQGSYPLNKYNSVTPIPSDEVLNPSKALTKKNCEAYYSHEEFSKKFVDDILSDAVETITNKYKKYVVTDCKVTTSDEKAFLWPTIREFDRRKAGLHIVKWIDSTAVVKEKWVYSMIMLSAESNHVSDIYKYEAKFSIPTKCYPIAQATASVFFECDVSKVKPLYCNIDVTFQLEGFATKFNPKRHIITDGLLFRVIDSKISVFKTFYF